jgi:hypothetical protein
MFLNVHGRKELNSLAGIGKSLARFEKSYFCKFEVDFTFV